MTARMLPPDPSADPRAALRALIADTGESYAALSRLIGRNPAYLQQFVTRGSPRMLSERDRSLLARYFRVDEVRLGAPPAQAPADALVRIQRIDAVAAAGPGGLLDGDRDAGGAALDPALLRRLGVRAATVSIITARGDSMLPTIADGDDMLVDRSDQSVGPRGAIFVLRVDGALVVKRVSRDAHGLIITSDNPAFAGISPEAADVIGRVVWLSRRL